jgi:hypothetical protein
VATNARFTPGPGGAEALASAARADGRMNARARAVAQGREWSRQKRRLLELFE